MGKLMMLTLIDSELADVEWESSGTYATTAVTSDTLLINGQRLPQITLSANVWYRFRMAFSAVQERLSISVPDGCEAYLLALDGVWLPDGARSISVWHFAAGNRVDVAFRCTSGRYKLASVEGRRLQGGADVYPAETIAAIVATDDGDVAVDLPTLTVTFPDYLPDLRTVTPANTLTDISLRGGRGCDFPCGAYDPYTATEYMTLGETHQWSVVADAHPLHVHVNHYQLASIASDPFDGWFQAGDYLDTFMGSGDIRFLADTFTGDVIAHCHFLEHEDEGCMARFVIVEDASAYAGQTCVGTTTTTVTTQASADTAATPEGGNYLWLYAVGGFASIIFVTGGMVVGYSIGKKGAAQAADNEGAELRGASSITM